MMPSFCQTTITVKRAPLVSSRGTQERDWSQATQHTISGCNVQIGSTSQTSSEPRVGASEDAVLYAPANADIETQDRIVCSYGEFAVDGMPASWVSPTGALNHTRVSLKRWKG